MQEDIKTYHSCRIWAPILALSPQEASTHKAVKSHPKPRETPEVARAASAAARESYTRAYQHLLRGSLGRRGEV